MMKRYLPGLISIAVIASDQLSKAAVSSAVALGQSTPVLKNIFHISLVHNTGAAFGLFKNQNIPFIALSIAVILYLTRDLILNGLRYNLTRSISLGLVLGGAAGNLGDRLRLGYIVDFLDFRIWPVFNIADSAITIGIMLLAIDILKHKV